MGGKTGVLKPSLKTLCRRSTGLRCDRLIQRLGNAMKLLWWSLATMLILLGLATVWLPIPTGVPLLALGLIVIIGTSRSAARLLRKRRRSTPPLNEVITWVENRSPLRFARILKRTRPRKKLPPGDPEGLA